MKDIAVSSDGAHLKYNVGPVFERARFFILVDPETREWEVLDNLKNLYTSQGVGLITAKSLARKNIRTVLTGSCGPIAFMELQFAGIEVVLNAKGTIRQALFNYLNRELNRTSKSNVLVIF
jgi:predicted Fe-Mo cluster-binding NifX family protein